MKRPKGTKSRRWARGLPNAWREYPHRTHLLCWPAIPGGKPYRCGTEPRALLWECSRETSRLYTVWFPGLEQLSAISCQPKAVSVKYIVWIHRDAPRPADLSPLKERGRKNSFRVPVIYRYPDRKGIAIPAHLHVSFIVPSPFPLPVGRGSGGRSCAIAGFPLEQRGVWGFIRVYPCLSVYLRRSEVLLRLEGRPNHIWATGVIHGKTGPLPNRVVGKRTQKMENKDLSEKSRFANDKYFLPFCSKSCLRRVP